MKTIWADNYRCYGYPRMRIVLMNQGISVSKGGVYRLSKKAGIRSLINRRFKKASNHVEYAQQPNLIKSLANRNSVWRAGITYLELRHGNWGYLSAILNETQNRVMARHYSQHMAAELVVNTVKSTLKINHAPEYSHSDMGSQYTSYELEGLLNAAGIKHSYSLQGHHYDNGPMEAYHSILKREFIFQTRFDSFEDLVVRPEAYIDWYNNQRISLKS